MRAKSRRVVLWFMLFAVVLAFSLHLRPFSACECEASHPHHHRHHPPGPHHHHHYDPISPKLDPFRVPWAAFVSQPSGRRVQVISVSQDHRVLPSVLPATLRSRTFHHLTAAEAAGGNLLHIFQIHLAVDGGFFDTGGDIQTPTACTFQTVELWLPSQAAAAGDGGGGGGENEGDTVKKLAAQAFTLDEPMGAAYRYKQARPQYLELIVRCAFLLSDETADQLVQRRHDVRFAVFAAREVAFFPLDHVLHFPRAAALLPTTRPVETAREPLPTAPWANSSDMAAIVRASGPDARLRVGAWITKKFTWTADDELWLLWTLDVVGVDHVVLELATQELSVESIRQRLARHESVLERVSLVGVDAPGRGDRVTYCYLQELLVWDGFVRWQADFDFVFLIDSDEFVQLFEREAPYRRIDAKTFIARNRQRLQAGGHAYMSRMRVGRTQDHGAVEAQLPAFLAGLISRDGAQVRELTDASGGGWDYQGKSLFFANGTVQPYLHYSVGYPTDRWPREEAHILHVRQDAHRDGANGPLTWWLRHLGS